MVIKPRIRGFVCITAHPEGCTAHVREQISYVKAQEPIREGPKNVLVIGASTGYGLASRISAAFGAGASTLGVFFERPSERGRPASAGWYNTAALEQAARAEGLYAASINGDAFSDEIKARAVEQIKKDLGQVDLVIYSLASPRRTHPKSGETFKSVLKPIGRSFKNKSVDAEKEEVTEVELEPATEEEIRNTETVMGGEDWEMWIDALEQGGVLAPGATTLAYSYIGPELTRPIYRDGTIGRAKADLEAVAERLDARLKVDRGRAFVAVNKAVVTQASSAIPVVPLYISLLFRIMKDKGLHEGCIEQMHRLLATQMYNGRALNYDEQGRVRVDDLEMRDDVQEEVARLWPQVTTENLREVSDIAGYKEDFLKLFGFAMPGVDYEADVDPDVPLSS